MEMYKRQQFEFLLQTAVERFSERLEQRCFGQEAIEQAAAGNLEPFGLNEFVDAIFSDFLLDNVEGACFILQALKNRRVAEQQIMSSSTIETALVQLAKQHFRELLRIKTQESIDLHSSYQAIQPVSSQSNSSNA